MTIQRNLSHLKSTKDREEEAALYAQILVQEWARLAQERGQLAHAVEGTSMRHSMAGKCARQIHYYLTVGDEGITNPFDLPAYWSTGLGTAVHQWWQDALARAFPNAELEKVVHLPQADSSGHVDAWLPDEKIAFELKSINGFGFKKIQEDNTGPRYGDFVQACINAYALDAERMVLIYLSLEAISRSRAKQKNVDEVGRIAKEFHYTPDVFIKVAEREIERWAAIREQGANTPRAIPDPEVPVGARIIDPSQGRWKVGDKTGYAWNCGYCSYQDLCCSEVSSES
jgi:hypothetical protein